MALEELELRDLVCLGHGVGEEVVVDLQLDLLEEVGHGRAGAAPVGIHVHHDETLEIELR